MRYCFNLIDQPWIPCIRKDGRRDELSLSDVLGLAHTLREIRGDTPLETASLLRLLLALLHRVFGPEHANAWGALWARRVRGFDLIAVKGYLDRPEIHDAFDLFGETRRFYQSNDPRAGKKSIISMALEMASGNNATLFDHHTELPAIAFTPAQAARSLIASQDFGLGGLSGLPDKFTDAPCAKGILFFAYGETVFETLVLNLVRYKDDKPIPQPIGDDLPTWEMKDPFQERGVPKGYLDYLTWHNRRIWLVPEELDGQIVVRYMSWAPGLRLDTTVTDPMKQYIGNPEEGYRPLCFRADRALWRDSSVLLRLGDSDRPPIVVRWMSDLARRGLIEREIRYSLMALGMAKDRASVDFLRAELMPLPLAFLYEEELVGKLSAALELAEKAADRLRMAVFNLARLMLNPQTSDDETTDERTRAKLTRTHDKSSDDEAKRVAKLARSWSTEERYWGALEPRFHRFIRDLPIHPAESINTWHTELRRAAKTAFDYAEGCISGDPRAAHAIAIASMQFYIGLKGLFPEQVITQDSEQSDA